MSSPCLLGERRSWWPPTKFSQTPRIAGLIQLGWLPPKMRLKEQPDQHGVSAAAFDPQPRSGVATTSSGSVASWNATELVHHPRILPVPRESRSFYGPPDIDFLHAQQGRTTQGSGFLPFVDNYEGNSWGERGSR